VASQTPENLTVIEEASELPILRPLIGMDKLEITNQAQQVGSFVISIEPDQDCCSLFTPPHPSTKTRLDDILKVERMFDIGALVKHGLDRVELSEFAFPPP
jgi:thiamine biosynthesis protein ThiI